MPGSDAALRGLIQGLLSGPAELRRNEPWPGLAAATRQQLSQLQALFQPRGALQSLTFKGVGPAGADIRRRPTQRDESRVT